MRSKLSVLLLRAPDSDKHDKYESAFISLGPQYRAMNVPVLETVLVNQDSLKEMINRYPNEEVFDGVILTSGRSCKAWKAAMDTMHSEPMNDIPFYVVGSATVDSLRQIYPSAQIRGEESGTAEQLARFVVEDLQRQEGRRKRLLYLTGDKNRDTLPKILHEGKVELETIQVYATQGSSSFAEDLGAALQNLEKDSEFWIVFFAPSVAEFVYPHLKVHFRFQSHSSGPLDDPNSLPLARIAAIGPTTATFLNDSLHLRVDTVAKKSNPEALVEAIVNSGGHDALIVTPG